MIKETDEELVERVLQGFLPQKAQTGEFDFLREHGYGVVYGKEAVLKKIKEISNAN